MNYCLFVRPQISHLGFFKSSRCLRPRPHSFGIVADMTNGLDQSTDGHISGADMNRRQRRGEINRHPLNTRSRAQGSLNARRTTTAGHPFEAKKDARRWFGFGLSN